MEGEAAEAVVTGSFFTDCEMSRMTIGGKNYGSSCRRSRRSCCALWCSSSHRRLVVVVGKTFGSKNGNWVDEGIDEGNEE